MIDVEQHRGRLFGIAYRMLGSAAEAEDMVQETFLRWANTNRGEIENPTAYLTTVLARLCIDQLRSSRVKRTEYKGPWLPEPVATDEPVDSESISMAFLSMLEHLSPAERAVYLLHHVFEYSFAEVAEITEKTEANCRQIFHRARRHLAEERPRFRARPEQHERLVGSFLHACSTGELAPIQALLAEDVMFWSDGGGKVQAVTRPLAGPVPVAKFFASLAGRAPGGARAEIRPVNGEAAIVLFVGGRVDTVITLETDGRQVRAIRAIRNPEKLERFQAPMALL